MRPVLQTVDSICAGGAQVHWTLLHDDPDGGEERLKGQASIGLGGHLDYGEDVADALFRELEEEVGLEKGQMSEIILCGYINSDLNEVDSVHLGIV